MFSLLFTQIMAIQYGTYVLYSWDIMEPITCLLGVFDMIVAYSFWLFTNNPYSYEAIGHRFVENRRVRYYRKDQLDLSEIEDIMQLIDHFESKKDLLSPNLNEVLKGLKTESEDVGREATSH